MANLDPRPPLWVGHIEMHTRQLDATDQCMQQIGMRPVFRNEGVSILELRGGTHLILVQDDDHKPCEADFDLMVEDIDETYKNYIELGWNLKEMQRGFVLGPAKDEAFIVPLPTQPAQHLDDTSDPSRVVRSGACRPL